MLKLASNMESRSVLTKGDRFLNKLRLQQIYRLAKILNRNRQKYTTIKAALFPSHSELDLFLVNTGF